MKKLISLFLFLNLYLVAYNQIIKGTILDKETKSPITYAAVYFNGTSVASNTDDKGFFKLDIRNNISMPLTISALGYYSTNINDFSLNKDILVYLTPKVFEMKEVAVSAKGYPEIRRQNLAIFRREFLGRTRNAKECEIINEDDIRFTTSSDKDTLKAFALKPIFIINNGLGYKITYYLNKFVYIKSEYLNQLIGNSLFDEDTTSVLDKQNFEIRRRNAYFGSKMHFFRSVWQNDLNPAGYIVNNSERKLTYKDLVRYQLSIDPDQTKKYIHYSGPLPVILSIKWLPGKAKSGMEIFKNSIYFDKNGYYKGPGIIWHGEMAKQGIADLLPYDYQPSEKVKDKSDTDFKIVDTLSADHIDNQVVESTEKVYLHTDRDFYNPGDDIWFKSYVVDGLTHKPSDNSGNLHVELISLGPKIMDSRKIRLNDGLGNGEFTLPDSLQSGKYRLRAYTNYMRNFGDQLFFNKDIIIVNGSDTIGVFSDPIKYSDSALDIKFFPEGGSLVDNVSSIVAFKAVNTTGSGYNVSGEIYSSAGDLITTFRSTHLGMGTFTLRPVPGFNYYATVKNSEGDVIKREIPKSFSKGFVLNAPVNQRNEHSIILKTNPETLPRFIGRDLLVTVSAHKKNLKALTVKIDRLFNSFILPTEELPDGIVMITLFGLDNLPLCERLIYVQNNEDVNVKIETDKKVYKQRDSVSVKLSLLEDFGTGQEAFLSLSATENIYTNRTSQFPSTISSWFLLESDVHGPVEEPSYYFDSSNPDRLKDLDLLLLTQGWRDFEWKYKEINYPPETCITISGRLRKSLADIPLKNSLVTIGMFRGGQSIITAVSTDSSGRFRLDLDNLTGSARLIVSAVDKKGNFQGRIALDSLDCSPVKVQENTARPNLPIKENLLINENLTLLKETDVVKKSIRKKYTLSDTILIDEVKIIGKKKETPQTIHINQSRIHYGLPDQELIITPQQESTRSIRDLLMGRVSGIMFTKPTSRNDSGIRIRGITSFSGNQEPIFMLDGLVVSYGEISSIPVSWIDRIDVLKSEKAAAFGMRGANGVISVITKTFENITYKPVIHSVNTKISGYDAPRIFYSPKHSSTLQTDYMPDLRTTLIWYPNIKVITNKDYVLKYFNADISSTYKLIVEGITSSGIPVTGKIEYEVR
jgi:hypothetical protein